MNDLNYCLVEGNLTKEPHYTQLKGDLSLCRFPVALNRSYIGKDGTRTDEASFIYVETWGKMASSCSKFLVKGRRVRVVGRIKQARWRDASDNDSAHERVYIIAEHVEFAPQKKEKTQQSDTAKEDEVIDHLDVQESMDENVSQGDVIGEPEAEKPEYIDENEHTETVKKKK